MSFIEFFETYKCGIKELRKINLLNLGLPCRQSTCLLSNVIACICQANETGDVSAQGITNRIIKLFMDRTNFLVELYNSLPAKLWQLISNR